MSAPTPRSKIAVQIRRSRLGDVPALVRFYRERSEESKSTYHPFPFGRFRLTLIYLWMVFFQRWMRWMIRRLPRRAATLLVAELPDGSALVGYGTVRLMSGRGEEPIARFGYVVRDDFRGKGVGGQLMEALVVAALELGIRKGGGTVLQTNAPSAHLIERWGWKLRKGETDRGAPSEVNLVTVGDLEELLRAQRQKREPPTGPAPGA